MNKRKAGLLVGIIGLFLASCSLNDRADLSQMSQSEVGVPDTAQDNAGTTEEAIEGGGTSEEVRIPPTLIGEKVITTIDMTYETLEYQDSVSHLKEIITEFDAYIETSHESTNQYDGYSNNTQEAQLRQGNFTIRIPAQSATDFLAALEETIGTKISEQIGNEDATQTYYDIQTRIEVLQQKEERLTELLSQATTVEDILAIENNLTETVAEREILQSQNDAIDDLVDYSSLHLTILERTRVANRPGSSLSFWERVQEAIVDSAYTFYYWLQDAAIWLIYVLPYLLVLAFILCIIWLARKTKWWRSYSTRNRLQSRFVRKEKRPEKQDDEKDKEK